MKTSKHQWIPLPEKILILTPREPDRAVVPPQPVMEAEQTGMVDLVVTLLPQFPLQHLPSLHLLPFSLSRQTMSTSSRYPTRVKTFHTWGKSAWRNSKARGGLRTLYPLPGFIHGLQITCTLPRGDLVAATIIILFVVPGSPMAKQSFSVQHPTTILP